MKPELVDGIHLLTLDEASQVINDSTLAGWDDALSTVEASQGPTALVVTGEGKTFNQGLDLPFIGGLGEAFPDFIRNVHQLFGRLLRVDVPTIAAMNGHTIAGGAMVALCMDLRIMRSDRGWFRLPEVELQMPFTTVMDGLVSARIPQPAQHRMMVLGERVGGEGALAAGAVDAVAEGEDGPREAAMAKAGELAQYRGPALRQIRTTRYGDLLASIDRDGDREHLFTP